MVPLTRWRRRSGPRLVLGRRIPGSAWLPFSKQHVVLDERDIHQHKHIIGLTGSGKSKLLASLFVQLHRQGIACGLLDPHRDLALDCLQLLADAGERLDGGGVRPILYIDFGRRDAFLPFNILKQPSDPQTIARNVVEACTRAWPALADGAAPTFENILLHSIVVLVENGYPLTVLPRLLTDQGFRDMSLVNVADRQVVDFFHGRYDRWGREGIIMRESTLNRIALLTFSPTLRYSLGQRENVLDFRRHLDEGISVIYNLGGLDEATQTLIGCLLTVGYEVAALERAAVPAPQRRPWQLIVDEFPQFSATNEATLARVLSLLRKFGVTLTLAHQHWSQVSTRLAGALQNTQCIAFRLGRSDAEWAARRFGRFDPHRVKHAIADSTASERGHPLFYPLPETYETWTQAIEDLAPREAYLSQPAGAVKFRTREIARPKISQATLTQLIEQQCSHLMRPAHQVIRQVDDEFASPPAASLYRRVALRRSA